MIYVAKEQFQDVFFFRNLLHDASNKRLKPNALRNFGRAIKEEKLSTTYRGSDIVGTSIDNLYSDLALQGYAIPRHRGKLAKVVNGQDLLNYNIRKKDGTKFASRRRRPGNPEDIIRNVLRKPSYPQDNIETASELKGARPINWVTKLSSLNQHISAGPERLRNILGLTHYNEDQTLCVIEYPANHPVKLKNPTALDAGFNYIFWSRGKRGSWGRTIDIETSSDGLPEAVHEPINLSPDFRFKLIGRLKRTAPSIDLATFKRTANTQSFSPCSSFCKVKIT